MNALTEKIYNRLDYYDGQNKNLNSKWIAQEIFNEHRNLWTVDDDIRDVGFFKYVHSEVIKCIKTYTTPAREKSKQLTFVGMEFLQTYYLVDNNGILLEKMTIKQLKEKRETFAKNEEGNKIRKIAFDKIIEIREQELKAAELINSNNSNVKEYNEQ